jgi:hypothetical protein
VRSSSNASASETAGVSSTFSGTQGGSGKGGGFKSSIGLGEGGLTMEQLANGLTMEQLASGMNVAGGLSSMDQFSEDDNIEGKWKWKPTNRSYHLPLSYS